MAKPSPDTPWPSSSALLMPMTLPRESTSGPPELPGLMAASVWMNVSPPRVRPGAIHGGDDAGGDGPLEPERVADGDRELTDLELVGVADRRDGDVVVGDAHDGDVESRVAPEHGARHLAAVGEPDLDLRRGADDVRVGEDHPVAPDHGARPRAVVRDDDADHGRRDLPRDADDDLLLAGERRLRGGGLSDRRRERGAARRGRWRGRQLKRSAAMVKRVGFGMGGAAAGSVLGERQLRVVSSGYSVRDWHTATRSTGPYVLRLRLLGSRMPVPLPVLATHYGSGRYVTPAYRASPLATVAAPALASGRGARRAGRR